MSVLIKGIKMPARCELCPFSGISGISCELVSCTFTGKHRLFNDGQYLEDCPLIEVPTHGRLIDADALRESIKEARKKDPDIEDVYTDDYFIVADWLRSAPTIIEREGE